MSRADFFLSLKNKVIFSGKRNFTFPDNTRKTIFHCNVFGKTIFSKDLEKENMVFCAVYSKGAGLQVLTVLVTVYHIPY